MSFKLNKSIAIGVAIVAVELGLRRADRLMDSMEAITLSTAILGLGLIGFMIGAIWRSFLPNLSNKELGFIAIGVLILNFIDGVVIAGAGVSGSLIDTVITAIPLIPTVFGIKFGNLIWEKKDNASLD